ncbi:MAG: M23 family metallopeptidase [Alphaproteobacteria bacterium]|nr:MAG: M23 family metallopeptidase [Alphaproteobacteria bacterium]
MPRFLSSVAFSCLLLLSGCGAAQAADSGTPAQALRWPVACTDGKDCWIARYVDRVPGPGAGDYMCGPRSQDGHKGIDILLSDLGRMQAGVPVLAAADGVVVARRDGEPDMSIRERGADEVEGRGCGNAVYIDHKDGSQARYCHMKNGSLTVAQGERVSAGQQIGEIGLSGQTEYPHLHFGLYRGGKVIDPFDGGTMDNVCSGGQASTSLWLSAPAYQPDLVLLPLFAAQPLNADNRWDAAPESLPANAPMLIFASRAFGVRKGDRWLMVITDPLGKVSVQKEFQMDRDRQFDLRYIGRRVPAGGFMAGVWKGKITRVRANAAPGEMPVTLVSEIRITQQ